MTFWKYACLYTCSVEGCFGSGWGVGWMLIQYEHLHRSFTNPEIVSTFYTLCCLQHQWYESLTGIIICFIHFVFPLIWVLWDMIKSNSTWGRKKTEANTLTDLFPGIYKQSAAHHLRWCERNFRWDLHTVWICRFWCYISMYSWTLSFVFKKQKQRFHSCVAVS